MNTESPNSPNFYLKQLIELGKNLMELESLVDQRESILQTAKSLFKSEINLWLLDSNDKNNIAPFRANSDEKTISPSPLMLAALNKKCILAGDTTEVQNQFDNREFNSTEKIIIFSQEASFAAAPIIHQEYPIGVIQISRSPLGGFSQFELELLENFTDQVAIAVFASRRVSTEKRQVELLGLVQSVSAQVADILDLDDLAHTVTQLILDTFKFYYVAIFTFEKDDRDLTFRASAQPISPNDSLDGEVNSPLPPLSVQVGQGIIGYVARNASEIIANDVTLNPHYRKVDTLHNTKSEAAIPLMIDTRILGVLDVQSDQLNAFDETDIMVLRVLADNIAKAVESAKLYSDIQLRVNQLTLVTEVSNAITSILDLDELLKEVVKYIFLNLKYPCVRIYSVHPGRRRIVLQAGFSQAGLVNLNEEVSYDLDNTSLEISRVSRLGKTQLIQDVTAIANIGIGSDIKSVQLIPLSFLDEVIGVLELQSNTTSVVKVEDQTLLESLADNIAIAMRNANLYRSELWRRQVAESMREVTGLLTASTATEQVLKLIFLELEKSLPCDIAAIWLITDQQEEPSTQLRLVDVHLTQEYTQNYGVEEGSLTAGEIQQILIQSELPSTWLQSALFSSEPKIRHPGDPYEPLGAILDFSEDYSAIAAPLWLKGEPFGILGLSHHTSGRYGHESQGMTETFANYAAVAIENTRLYETAHDQAWVSTVLLQVSEATQTVSTLDELLTTLVQLTPMLLGVNSCSVFLWDNSADLFNPTSSFGLQASQLNEFYSRKIHLGEIPCFDQLLLTKGPIFINQQSSNSYFTTFDLDSKGLVLFPMISHNEVLGAFLIDYTLNQSSTNLHNITQEIDWEQKYSIIQGIAHQAAIAVENIRLIKAQRDEAYVSIALLQVAQAIVSLNELDEILETIVRITPILVGVKRSMIFIWDSNDNTFNLMQSYGVSKTDLILFDRDFTSVEFPLLTSVRNSNSIVYQEIDEDLDSPLTWFELDGSGFDFIESENISDLNVINPDTQKDDFWGKDHLSANKGLLYGFPLAVKGIVLGVLLTQEREGPGDLPSRQIREKRLEISIGISQQAAMAIQNDLLQREVVERERLEREFQLARSIQQTFLPETLPQHERWELFSLWRPAREVSGDFYDVIPLKDEKWGLVIADVADKGMPAALYMTLIRTLIRASTKDDDDSPSSVLQRVNNLLVADSKSGMFVTIVYGVLAINSYSLDYANAGHNPPLLIRKDHRRLQRLTGTGMALGIFEGIEIRQNTVRLKPGDSIVFYTDGITEAFSPDEKMYGEKRLIQVIRQCNTSQAQELAQAIDKSVTSFIEDGSSTDDITMLVLNRLK